MGPTSLVAAARGAAATGLVAHWPVPSGGSLRRYFSFIPEKISVNFQDVPRSSISAQNNTMAILLKTASVRVSSIQIMQIRVQNKGKRVWKSRYDGDVSTPPSLKPCLSSSNSVDKLKETKEKL